MDSEVIRCCDPKVPFRTGALKDSVCSPAGSTIQGVRTLEERGMRAAVFDAVIAAYEKNCDLKKASE